MNFSDYQKESRKTAEYSDQGNNYMYPLLGLAGESGEVVEKFKKMIRNNDGVMTDEIKKGIKKELGDLLWYVAQICTEIDLDLDDVATTNIEKLKDRSKRGVVKSEGDNR
jgi:NTP pyrophosphatase (non-canonical NTP hydrolase)